MFFGAKAPISFFLCSHLVFMKEIVPNIFLFMIVFILGGIAAVFSIAAYAKHSIPDNFYVKNYCIGIGSLRND